MVSIFASTLCSFKFRKNFKRKLPKNLNPEYIHIPQSYTGRLLQVSIRFTLTLQSVKVVQTFVHKNKTVEFQFHLEWIFDLRILY